GLQPAQTPLSPRYDQRSNMKTDSIRRHKPLDPVSTKWGPSPARAACRTAKLGCDSIRPADRQGGENVTRRCASSDDQPCAPIGAGVAVDGLDCVVIASVAGGR